MSAPHLPQHRWQITPATESAAAELAQQIELTIDAPTSPLIAQVLINRGVTTAAQVDRYVHGLGQDLPDPAIDFLDLEKSLDLLVEAIDRSAKIAICGDYDADGMTSTALLLRALRTLGAQVHYEIPSRMSDGYGINCRIVEKFHAEGIELVLTVDNGIAAYDAVARAVELGLKVIITDHHDLPPQLPPADAILNPKLIPEDSIYYTIAGVGVAYLMAVALAEKIGGDHTVLNNQMLELFTLGTIADLAALTGINRTLVRQGLKLLPNSQILGVQALIEASGAGKADTIKPEDIGFRLGPRINAIGRIGDPQIVIELLTTTDADLAQDLAKQCEETNRQRQELCAQIEQEAIELIQTSRLDFRGDRILVVVKDGWHHGVIGIVASRLVERYGVPVFIGTYEENGQVRGSARSIPEFNIFQALEFGKDLLLKHGGHPAAGGFSMEGANLPEFKQRLRTFAHQSLEPEHLRPLVRIDAIAQLTDINPHTYQQIDAIQPCGIGNPEPIFWSENVRVKEQRKIGQEGNHLKVMMTSPDWPEGIKGVAWRWGEYFPLPDRLDIAYKLRENTWRGQTTIEMELVSTRLPASSTDTPAAAINVPLTNLSKTQVPHSVTDFSFKNRSYQCSLSAAGQMLEIVNADGQTLTVTKGQKMGLLRMADRSDKQVDVTEPYFYQLIKAAMQNLSKLKST
jgi:single-stranded-DNA-specific exonuclease